MITSKVYHNEANFRPELESSFHSDVSIFQVTLYNLNYNISVENVSIADKKVAIGVTIENLKSGNSFIRCRLNYCLTLLKTIWVLFSFFTIIIFLHYPHQKILPIQPLYCIVIGQLLVLIPNNLCHTMAL